jgi:hypothetical protein
MGAELVGRELTVCAFREETFAESADALCGVSVTSADVGGGIDAFTALEFFQFRFSTPMGNLALFAHRKRNERASLFVPARRLWPVKRIPPFRMGLRCVTHGRNGFEHELSV